MPAGWKHKEPFRGPAVTRFSPDPGLQPGDRLGRGRFERIEQIRFSNGFLFPTGCGQPPAGDALGVPNLVLLFVHDLGGTALEKAQQGRRDLLQDLKGQAAFAG
jgi:hypothetical protein